MLAYLSRHTHRVAISNHRLITVDERGITFKVKDCRVDGAGRYTTMTLDVIRLPHPRPSQDGLFANSNRAEMIAAARELLNLAPSRAERTIETDPTAAQALAQSRLCFPKSKPQDEERVRFRLHRERNLIERFFNKKALSRHCGPLRQTRQKFLVAVHLVSARFCNSSERLDAVFQSTWVFKPLPSLGLS